MNQNVDHIFVDLDGTVIRTDLFFEAILRLIKRNPLYVFRICFWLVRGRSFAKERVAELVDVDATHLPYETSLLDYLRAQRKLGKRLVLATASHRTYAEKIAGHLGLFDDVIATSNGDNLKGSRKLAAIEDYVQGREFAYAGDSAADRPIWGKASANIFVNAPHRDVISARKAGKDEEVFQTGKSVFKAFLAEMRPHQYAKNALIFVPLFTSHSYVEPSHLVTAILAFVCFSLCASGVYFLNDLLDLEADRQHPTKRNRPLASGDLPAIWGVVGATGLPLAAFMMAVLLLPIAFVAVLGGYFLLTNAYSFYLKRISTADVMTLAMLYTLRVVAGAAAIGVAVSSWLMAFSVFVFVSLAYLKRYIEVAALSNDGGKAQGRGYSAADSETMFSLGIANITAAVLVLALYINSEEVIRLYHRPEILWGLCLLLLYWGNRIWVGARRGKINEDPVVFAIKDKVSRMVGGAFLAVVLAAKFVDL